MTTEEKIKAFINENAKYKVGQTVYTEKNDKPCKCVVTDVEVDQHNGTFDYYYHGRWICGLEPQLRGSFEELRAAVISELEAKLAKWRLMTEEDVIDIDADDD